MPARVLHSGDAEFLSRAMSFSCQQMVERGVEFTSPPQKEPWGTFAAFKDPDGNQFVLSSR